MTSPTASTQVFAGSDGVDGLVGILDSRGLVNLVSVVDPADTSIIATSNALPAAGTANVCIVLQRPDLLVVGPDSCSSGLASLTVSGSRIAVRQSTDVEAGSVQVMGPYVAHGEGPETPDLLHTIDAKNRDTVRATTTSVRVPAAQSALGVFGVSVSSGQGLQTWEMKR